MYTVNCNVINEIVIKNSRFIALIYKINTKDDINKYLDNSKVLYPKATHYTYAYILSNSEKASDNGEPSGTAGIPILNVLKRQSLVNILVIVIRYYGGIKLGAGGLIRAYSKSTSEGLKQTNLVSLIKASLVEIIITYEEQKDLEFLLKKGQIVSKEFNSTVTYKVLVEDLNVLKNKYEYSLIKEQYIEKRV